MIPFDVVEKKQLKQIRNGAKKDIKFEVDKGVWARDYRSPPRKWTPAVVTRRLETKTYEVNTIDKFIWKRHVDQVLPKDIPLNVTNEYPTTNLININYPNNISYKQ